MQSFTEKHKNKSGVFTYKFYIIIYSVSPLSFLFIIRSILTYMYYVCQ